MVLTPDVSRDEIDEALTYLRADWQAARAAGDLERHLRLAEEIDGLLEQRPHDGGGTSSTYVAGEKSSDASLAAETSLPLSPRHRPGNSQQPAGGLGPRG